MKFTNSSTTMILLAGCATIKGKNIAEQKQYVHDMKEETLTRLYDEYPVVKEQNKNSV